MIGFRNAANLADAIDTLTDLATWKAVCGGTDVLVQLGMGRMAADGFVNLWGVLPQHIEASGSDIRIGAGASCTALARSTLIRDALFPLWEAARTMGSTQIRNRATLGGNIGNASPAADMVAALMVDDARVVIRNAEGDRTMPLHRLFVGPGQTILEPGELVIELIVPRPPDSSYSRFDKLGFRQAQVIAAVNFAIRITGRSGGIDEVRITWGSVAPTPVRSHAVEGVLRGTALAPHTIAAALDALASDVSPIDDHRSSAAYRMAVARGFLRRALEECTSWITS
jgi:carbon-monoxide dehydrogenase medium subunit